MNPYCQISSAVHNGLFWWFVVEIVIAIVIFIMLLWVIKLINHIREKNLVRLAYFIMALIASIILFIFISSATLIVGVLTGLIPADYPPSTSYHSLNAAIKNTCFLDPQRNHCPKIVQDIISIEPDNFTKLTENAHITYQYYPETNEYTLIVRNNNLWVNGYRVAIFDPRLATVKNYGNGVDFFDADVAWCNGKYILTNPPPFPGPWDKIN